MLNKLEFNDDVTLRYNFHPNSETPQGLCPPANTHTLDWWGSAKKSRNPGFFLVSDCNVKGAREP